MGEVEEERYEVPEETAAAMRGTDAAIGSLRSPVSCPYPTSPRTASAPTATP